MNPEKYEVIRNKFMRMFQLVSRYERHQCSEIIDKANDILWQLERVRRQLAGSPTALYRRLPYEEKHPVLTTACS